jgi:hypothetical protein
MESIYKVRAIGTLTLLRGQTRPPTLSYPQRLLQDPKGGHIDSSVNGREYIRSR